MKLVPWTLTSISFLALHASVVDILVGSVGWVVPSILECCTYDIKNVVSIIQLFWKNNKIANLDTILIPSKVCEQCIQWRIART